MPEINENPPATVPPQREAVGPVKKSTPVVIALIVIVALIGIANISSLVERQEEDPHRPVRCRCGQRLQTRNRCPASRPSSRCRRAGTQTTSSAGRCLPPRCSSFSNNRPCLVLKRMERPG